MIWLIFLIFMSNFFVINNCRPEVMHNVRLRYQQEQIYTYSGIVLIAMNPFAKMNIYSPEIMR
jgi:myosin heavy subunit